MIITKLKGGMGNQLFQYALGRSVAAKHNTELKLDNSWFGVVPDRQYDLDHFNITGTLATNSEVNQFCGPLARLFNRNAYIKEKYYRFDPDVLASGDNIYLEGYWQSPKYFENIADIIRQECTIKGEAKGKNAETMKLIKNTNAISLHVRRGDYVASKSTNKFHGTSPLAYYEAAVAKLAEKVKKPHFFIFSDDSKWTKENLKLDYPMTFIVGNDEVAEEDLRLMTNCQHFIIANSTFSWWGAWLATNPNKIIITPKTWFAARPGDEADLIPQDWIRL